MSDRERAIAIRVTGRVQGVNYRDFTKSEASRLGVKGWVVNRDDGSVEAAFYGAGDVLATLIAACRQGPPDAEVATLDVSSTDRGSIAEPPAGAYRF